jgi:hypothetical protein
VGFDEMRHPAWGLPEYGVGGPHGL